MPSGVVRAYDARTGELAWAWDLGNPSNTGLPGPGQTYTRSTPNVWGTITADEKLGLVYLPTGNPAPDFWTGKRRSEEHTSELQSLMRISYAVFCLKQTNQTHTPDQTTTN